MDYCSAHFGKKLAEVTFGDVENFFATEKTETDQLEFKSFAGNVNDNYRGLIQTICAFLNSKGGLLIWGAPAGVSAPNKNEKIFLGQLTPINQVLAKDPLISKCSDSITPLPTGIRVSIIENDNQECVCIFEIDESDYAPHQYERIYQMRIDGQNKPAPHHYIEALFKKIRFPQLEGYIKLTGISMDRIPYAISFDIYFFNWSPFQIVEDLSFRVVCDYGLFRGALDPSLSQHYHMSGHEYRRQSFRSTVQYGEPIRDANEISIDPREVFAKKSNVVFLALFFSAKNCPTKSSEYYFDLRHLQPSNPEFAVTERNENQSLKDLQEKKGMSKQLLLKQLLQR